LRPPPQIKVLGQGGYGAAILVSRRSDPSKKLVIKEVSIASMGKKERADAEREVAFLKELSHPNIVAFEDAFVDRPTKKLCIVMEFADGGDLSCMLKRHESGQQARGGAGLDEEHALGLFVQLLLALRHLHDRRIVHRDIKSQNVFLTQR